MTDKQRIKSLEQVLMLVLDLAEERVSFMRDYMHGSDRQLNEAQGVINAAYEILGNEREETPL